LSDGHDHRLLLWTHGPYSCVLLSRFTPHENLVQVTHNGRVVCAEPCADPDDAAALAEQLFKIFVDNPV
jgi:hypothetical protein